MLSGMKYLKMNDGDFLKLLDKKENSPKNKLIFSNIAEEDSSPDKVPRNFDTTSSNHSSNQKLNRVSSLESLIEIRNEFNDMRRLTPPAERTTTTTSTTTNLVASDEYSALYYNEPLEESYISRSSKDPERIKVYLYCFYFLQSFSKAYI